MKAPDRVKLSFAVCASTTAELLTWPGTGSSWRGDTLVKVENTMALVLTGVGIPLTLARLLPFLEMYTPAFLINTGIAGAYPDSGMKPGDIAIGKSEVYGDVGMELPSLNDNSMPGFQHLGQTDFGCWYKQCLPLAWRHVPIINSRAYQCLPGAGCSVNVCTGTHATALRRQSQWGAAFETMEGAAAAHAGWLYQIPVVEIRAISNMADNRNITSGSIKNALSSLTQYLESVKGIWQDENILRDIALS